MADISKITLPSGSTYDIKDTTARSLIDTLQSYSSYLGVTTTILTDGAETAKVTIDSKEVTAVKGNIVNYGKKEFIFNGSVWQEFGDLSALGALAYKATASGSITPAGSVSTPTFTGSAVSYTPSGTVSKPTATVTPTTATVNSITEVGTLPSLTTTVSNEILTIGFSQGTLPTKGSNQTVMTGASVAVSQPTFTGTQGSITATGTVSKPTFTGTAATVTVK